MLLKSVSATILVAAMLTAQPSFEVAAIKPSDPDSQLKIDFAAGGRLIVTHATLRFLIKIAYDVGDDQISGGPGWINSTRFDLQGKPSAPTTGNLAIRLRLQRLLADRFRLEMRRESKPLPIFALVTAKNGAKLKPDATPGASELKTGSGRGILTATRTDMPTLAHFLSEGQTGRPVQDMTGLAGTYDFRLEWTPDPTAPGAAPPADPNGISIFTALQQQLGLRLEARTGAADYFVVTRAEPPSAN